MLFSKTEREFYEKQKTVNFKWIDTGWLFDYKSGNTLQNNNTTLLLESLVL